MGKCPNFKLIQFLTFQNTLYTNDIHQFTLLITLQMPTFILVEIWAFFQQYKNENPIFIRKTSNTNWVVVFASKKKMGIL